MDKQPNPIPFNPDQMTISQAKDCADLLSTLFRSIDNNNEPEAIVAYLVDERQRMLKKYGAPK